MSSIWLQKYKKRKKENRIYDLELYFWCIQSKNIWRKEMPNISVECNFWLCTKNPRVKIISSPVWECSKRVGRPSDRLTFPHRRQSELAREKKNAGKKKANVKVKACSCCRQIKNVMIAASSFFSFLFCSLLSTTSETNRIFWILSITLKRVKCI